MTDIFDEEETQKDLAESFQASTAARDAARASIIQGGDTLATVNEEMLGALNRLEPRYNDTFAETQETFDNLERIQKFGPIGDLLGIFNPKWNEEVQRIELQRESVTLQQLNSEAARTVQQQQIKTTIAQGNINTATSLYQFDRQGFLDIAAMAELGFKFEAQVEQKVVAATQNVPLEQLKKWQAGDTAGMPAILKNATPETRAGLIEISVLEKTAKAANVDMAQASAILQQNAVANQDRANTFRELDAVALEAIATGMETNTLITPADAVAEITRREEQQISIESAKLSLAAGNAQHADLQRARFLSRSQIPELQTILEQSGEAGQVEIEGVVFKTQEIADALASKTTTAREAKLAQDTRMIEQISSNIVQAGARKGLQQIIGVTSPNTNTTNLAVEEMIAMLPPDIQGTAAAKFVEMRSAEVFNNPEILVKKANELQGIITNYQQTVVDRAAENQRPALKEFMDTGDIRDTGNLSSAIIDMGNNRHLLDGNPVMGPAFRKFSDALQTTQGTKTTAFQISPRGEVENFGTLQQVTKLTDAQAVSMAVSQSGARGIITDTLLERMLVENISRLEQGAPNGAGRDLWGGLVDPRNGRLTDAAYKFDKDGNRSLSFGQITDVLSAKSVALRERGILSPSSTLNEILINELRNTARASADGQKNGFEQTVFSNLLFPAGGLVGALNTRISEFDAKTPESMRAITSRQEQLKNDIATAQQMDIANQKNIPTFGAASLRNIGPVIQKELEKDIEGDTEFNRLINEIITGGR